RGCPTSRRFPPPGPSVLRAFPRFFCKVPARAAYHRCRGIPSSVLLTSRILYAVHDFQNRSPARTSGRPEALLCLRGLCDLCGGPSLVAARPRCAHRTMVDGGNDTWATVNYVKHVGSDRAHRDTRSAGKGASSHERGGDRDVRHPDFPP